MSILWSRSSHSSQIDRGGRDCAVNVAAAAAAMGKSETNSQMVELGDY